MKIIKGFLSIALFAFTGFVLAAWITSLGMPKASGLAGPGIVVGYGFFGAIVGIVIGVLFLIKAGKKTVSFIALIGLVVLVVVGVLGRTRMKSETTIQPLPKAPVTPAVFFQKAPSMGLGVAYPKISGDQPLYFYNPNLEKAVDEHLPYDSLSFVENETGPEISYAPPWFYPEIMKMDYNILAFKVISMTKDWIQVEVNKQTKRTVWLNIFDVRYVPWESFLLNVNSVEVLNPENNPIRARPFSHASPTNLKGSFLIPKEVRNEWLRVDVVNDDFLKKGSGWIRWKNGTELLVSYNLFS